MRRPREDIYIYIKRRRRRKKERKKERKKRMKKKKERARWAVAAPSGEFTLQLGFLCLAAGEMNIVLEDRDVAVGEREFDTLPETLSSPV